MTDEFFSDLRGSTITETVALLLHVPVCLLLVRATSGGVLNELICVVAVLLVCFTVLASHFRLPWTEERLLPPERAAMSAHVLSSALVLLAIATVLHLFSPRRSQPQPSGADARPAFITFYRAGMMLATCVAILAVDFTVFPRRFAKTETFGVSLMDLGVGGFVFSMALVSHQARQQAVPLRRALSAVVPLLTLGVVRLLLTRGASLDVQSSEYGVHWNFFMTLTTIAVFVALLRVRVELSALIGLALLGAYQLALSRGGLTEYILEHPRSNVLHANKEGLCSWIGYLALYLIGAWCGSWMLNPRRSRQELLWRGTMLLAACWLATWCVSETVQAPSRRMANAAYVLLTVAVNVQTLLLCAVASFVTPSVPLPLIDAINGNQLAVFLVANLATGAVNLSMRARDQSAPVAMAVLVCYTLTVCGAALGLQRTGWKLKL
jgi:phosphatidylinositol glycan class W